MKAVAFALPWAAGAMAPNFGAAGEAIRAAGAATSDVAERLPNWYSSKQGLTEESPAVFGTAGMGLTHAGGALVDGRDPAADITFAACALEPIELDTDLQAAADAHLLIEDPLAPFGGIATRELCGAWHAKHAPFLLPPSLHLH